MRTEHQRLQSYTVLRTRFVCKSLLAFVLFVFLTIGQFCLVIYFDGLSLFLKDHLEISVSCFFLGLLHMILFVFVEGVRFSKPFNWFIGLMIVECMIIAISRTMLGFSFWHLLTSVTMVLLIIIIFYTIAAFIPHDFTLDVIVLFVLSYIFFIGGVYFLTIFLIDKVNFAFYLFSGIVTFVVCMFIMYHSQTILGGHYAEMRLNDYLLAALILFVDFLLLFLISLNFVPQIVKAIGKN